MPIRHLDPEAERHNVDMYKEFQMKQVFSKTPDIAFVSTPFRRYSPHIQSIDDKAEVVAACSGVHVTMTMEEWLHGIDNGSWRCLEVLFDVEALRSEIGESFFMERKGLIHGKALNLAATTQVQFIESTQEILRNPRILVKFETYKILFKPFIDRFVTALARTQMCKELLYTETCTTQVRADSNLFLRLQHLRKFKLGAFTRACVEEWDRELEADKEGIILLAWEGGMVIPPSGVIQPGSEKTKTTEKSGGKKVAKA